MNRPAASLIINADDFGIATQTNRAIADGFQRGVITSTSLMANMPARAEAVRLARDLPGLQVGVHLCLTSGRALLPAAQVDLLADAAGRLRHSFASLWRLLGSPRRAAALAQIAAEARAQMDWIHESGLTPSHLDSHQHVHMLPELFPLVAGLAHEAGVPVRRSVEPVRFSSFIVGPQRLFKGATGLLKSVLLARCARTTAGLHGAVPRSDCCFGILHSGRMTAAVLQRLLQILPGGVVEWITHPGAGLAGDEGGELSAADRAFLNSPYRRREYEAVLDPSLRQALAEAGVQLAREPVPQPRGAK